MENIILEVEIERQYQINKWGIELDDQNTPANWANYICQYATRNLIGIPSQDVLEFRRDMLKVATLAIAAIEAIDRKKDTA